MGIGDISFLIDLFTIITATPCECKASPAGSDQKRCFGSIYVFLVSTTIIMFLTYITRIIELMWRAV